MNQIKHSGEKAVINTAHIFHSKPCCLKPDLPEPQQKLCSIRFPDLKEITALTCTLLSGKLIFMATSSLMKISGYFVFVKSSSKISS